MAKNGISTLTIHREGEFKVKTTGEFHCGTLPILKVRYSFKAVCDVTDLDNRGFLFDQTRVQVYFDSIITVAVSCERMAIAAARGLFAMIRQENKGCNPKALELTLSPEPFAARLTFEWKGGK